MDRIFRDTYNLKNLDGIEDWDTGSVTSLISAFSGCRVVELDLSGWDVSNVTSMNYIFDNTALKTIDISGWDTRKNTDFNGFFYGCVYLEEVTLGSNFVMNVNEYFLNNAGKYNSTGTLRITCPVVDTWDKIAPTYTGSDLIRVQ